MLIENFHYSSTIINVKTSYGNFDCVFIGIDEEDKDVDVYTIWVQKYPGILSQSDTIEEGIENIKKAIENIFEHCKKTGIDINDFGGKK